MSAGNYDKAMDYLIDVVSDPSQPQSEKDAAIEIAANLNDMWNGQVLQPGEHCFYCGYEHAGAPGVRCNGGEGWEDGQLFQ